MDVLSCEFLHQRSQHNEIDIAVNETFTWLGNRLQGIDSAKRLVRPHRVVANGIIRYEP